MLSREVEEGEKRCGSGDRLGYRLDPLGPEPVREGVHRSEARGRGPRLRGSRSACAAGSGVGYAGQRGQDVDHLCGLSAAGGGLRNRVAQCGLEAERAVAETGSAREGSPGLPLVLSLGDLAVAAATAGAVREPQLGDRRMCTTGSACGSRAGRAAKSCGRRRTPLWGRCR